MKIDSKFKGVCGAFLGIAIIAAIARTSIQVQQYRRLRLDDYTLIFGCITFIAASVLLYISLDAVYWITGVTTDPSDPAVLRFITAPNFAEELSHHQRIVFAYLTLTITTIFAMKLTFIIFFRPMVDKLPYMIMYWKGLLIFTLVSYIFTMLSNYIECPHFGFSACGCSCLWTVSWKYMLIRCTVSCTVGVGFQRTLGISAAVTGLDILTDLMSESEMTFANKAVS